jgi:hypothetical protein
MVRTHPFTSKGNDCYYRRGGKNGNRVDISLSKAGRRN